MPNNQWMDQQNLERLSKNFSDAAQSYDEYALIQKEISTILFDLLPEKPYQKVLDIGCGTGKNSLKLSQKYPNAEITLCDIAPLMLEHAQNIMPEGTKFICGDAQVINFPDKYDLIFSNMSIQWFEDIPYSIKRLQNYLNEGGCIVASLLVGNSFFEWYDSLLQVDENFVPPLEKYIDWRGLNFSVFTNFQKIEQFSSSKDFFKMLKSIGAYAHKSDDNISVSKLLKAADIFTKKYNNQITYDICCFVVNKK